MPLRAFGAALAAAALWVVGRSLVDRYVTRAIDRSQPGLTPRQEYTRSAMVILMSQHPEATRGWIAERSIEMADVMVERERRPVTPAPEKAFACDLRQYAEDEPAPPPEQG